MTGDEDIQKLLASMSPTEFTESVVESGSREDCFDTLHTLSSMLVQEAFKGCEEFSIIKILCIKADIISIQERLEGEQP